MFAERSQGAGRFVKKASDLHHRGVDVIVPQAAKTGFLEASRPLLDLLSVGPLVPFDPHQLDAHRGDAPSRRQRTKLLESIAQLAGDIFGPGMKLPTYPEIESGDANHKRDQYRRHHFQN